MLCDSRVRVIYVELCINRRAPRCREKTARPMCKLALNVKYRRTILTIDCVVFLDTKRGKSKSPVVSPYVLSEILCPNIIPTKQCLKCRRWNSQRWKGDLAMIAAYAKWWRGGRWGHYFLIEPMESFAMCAFNVHATTTMLGRGLSIGEASNSRIGWEPSMTATGGNC